MTFVRSFVRNLNIYAKNERERERDNAIGVGRLVTLMEERVGEREERFQLKHSGGPLSLFRETTTTTTTTTRVRNETLNRHGL